MKKTGKVLRCPSCGAPVRFNDDLNVCICEYCKSEVRKPEPKVKVVEKVVKVEIPTIVESGLKPVQYPRNDSLYFGSCGGYNMQYSSCCYTGYNGHYGSCY